MRTLNLIIVLSYAALGQEPAKLPEFEVADVQVSKSVNPEPGKGRVLPGGRIEVPNTTLKNLMMAAYNVQENMITGGPGWLDTDRFDVIAKAPPDTPRPTMFLMLRALLADRFKLQTHREDKPMPVYAMVVGKTGPKIQKTAGGAFNCKWNMPGNGRVQRDCVNITLQQLADEIPLWGMAKIGLPVVNMTDIPGAFDIHLEWSAAAGGADAPAEMSGPTFFDAMSQIGLKLEPRKRPISVIVVDRAERVPAGN